MTLLFLIALLLFIPAIFLWRDRRFLKKNLKDVIQKEDVKAYLNRPHSGARFSEDLEKERQKPKPSRSWFNDSNPND